MARVLDEDGLIEHWTLVGDELGLLTGRTGPSSLGLALWLKFFIAEGRFPSGRSELPDGVPVIFGRDFSLARQGLSAVE